MPVNLPKPHRRKDGLGHYEAAMYGKTPMLLIAEAVSQCGDEQVKANARRALEAINAELRQSRRLSAEDFGAYGLG